MPPDLLLRISRLPEAEKMSLFRDYALSALAADPARYARLCMRRLRYFILFDETNPMTLSPWYRWPRIVLLSVFAWSVWRLRKRQSELSLLYLFLITGALFHTLTIFAPRFQIAFDPLIILIASGGVAQHSAASS